MYLEIILSILAIIFLLLLLEIRKTRKVLDSQSRIILSGIVDQKENTEYYKDAIMKLLSEVSVFRKRLENNFEDKKMIEDELLEEISDDILYEQAVEYVKAAKKASASSLQRKFEIGYARAARLLDLMEEGGIIGPANGAKPREVIVN